MILKILRLIKSIAAGLKKQIKHVLKEVISYVHQRLYDQKHNINSNI